MAWRGDVMRTWQSPGGADGDGWTGEQVAAFEALMRECEVKAKGRPALVSAWDDGRGRMCWYCAHAGPDEVALRDRCRTIFGAREREPDGWRG